MTALLNKFLRFFFHLLYHQLAWAYDLVAWLVSGGRWVAWIHTVLPYLRGERLLEVGFGTGHLQRAAEKAGFRIAGLDGSWQMCGRFVGSYGSKLGLGVVNGYAQYAPFENNTFDQIICTFPAEFISDPQALSEFYRLLVPGGELLILPYAWISSKRPFDRLLAWIFQITGEAPPRSSKLERAFQSRLTAAGFAVTFLYPPAPSSQVMLILASKPHSPTLLTPDSPN